MSLLKPGRRGGSYLGDALHSLGVRHLFSLPGSQLLSVWDALCDHGILQLVVPRSEWSGAFMAEGYGAAGGRPAAVMNTLGPGVANETIGMASARSSGTPVLFVSPGQPPPNRARLGAVFQGLDQRRMLEPLVRASRSVDRPDALGPALLWAMRQCLGPPSGPVRVEISFPMLFERHAFQLPEPAPPVPPPGAADCIVVRETPPAPAPSWLSGDFTRCRVLTPGFARPGYALPFALGARLSRDDVPVLAITDPRHLLDNADVLSVAQVHGVPVHILSREKPRVPGVETLAGLFGAGYQRFESDDALAGRSFGTGPTLAILCA
jgi:thiamine pyrophosphate-dependent acetolactate synthase large subunit-like protein